MNKTLKTVLISFGVLLLALIVIFAVIIGSIAYPEALVSGEGDLRIICVGDSITYGQGVYGSRRSATFTAYLADMIEDSTVVNYGLSSRTLQSSADMPYTNEKHFAASRSEDADVVIIMLGTNDSKASFWDKENYTKEYEAFIKGYMDMESSPEVYIMIPPRVYAEVKSDYDCDNAVVSGELREAVVSLGATLGVEVIDLYSVTDGHPEWFPDGLHPNADGNYAIAEEIARVIKQ